MHRIRLGVAAVSLSIVGAAVLPVSAAHSVGTTAAAGVLGTQAQVSSTVLTVSITFTQRSADGKVTGQAVADGPNPVTDYRVDYGDGTVVDQHNGVLSHWYATNWPFTVTVTVTDSAGVHATAALQSSVDVPNTLTRLAGTTRYETGAAVSRQFWADAAGDSGIAAAPRRQAQAVVLASGANFPDALAGVPLAAAKQGPLLLTEPGRLTDVTLAEIRRILPRNSTVYVLGGQAAISPIVESALNQAGYHVVRYGGRTRYETALIIAEQGLGSPASVLVATGQDFPDALAAGPMASGEYAAGGRPAAILLSDGDRIDDPATAAYVRSHVGFQNNGTPQRAAVAIGHQATAAVLRLYGPDLSTTEIDQAITWHQTGGHGDFGVQGGQFEFFAGANRYETAAATAESGLSSQGGLEPYSGFASGVNFADALTGGAALAVLHGPLVLSDPNQVPGADMAEISRIAGRGGSITKTSFIFGGAQAISQGVEDQLAGSIHATER